MSLRSNCSLRYAIYEHSEALRPGIHFVEDDKDLRSLAIGSLDAD